MLESQDQPPDAMIIGAGLAGLACARRLHAASRSFVVCEAADRVGGRVADPFRHPVDGRRGAFNPIGSFADKLRAGGSRLGGFDFSRHTADLTTLQALQAGGFSESMMRRPLRHRLDQ